MRRPWYSLGAVARATRVSRRYLRHLAETGRVNAPTLEGEPGTRRRWTRQTLRQLEQLGIIVDRAKLDTDGPNGPNGSTGPT